MPLNFNEDLVAKKNSLMVLIHLRIFAEKLRGLLRSHTTSDVGWRLCFSQIPDAAILSSRKKMLGVCGMEFKSFLKSEL